ncbi:proteasome, alpha subunit [Mycobacteroides abscessus subsp. abscessus]|nr:proteasome, alpha subunit [Mycobacteroides abscessus subsp. abscessus]
MLYRITYDGSIADEPHWVVMGGNTEPVINSLKESYVEDSALKDAVGFAVKALQAGTAGANGSEGRALGGLEVAVLEQSRPRRAFRRIKGAALEALLPEDFSPGQTEGGGDPAPESGDSKDAKDN